MLISRTSKRALHDPVTSVWYVTVTAFKVRITHYVVLQMCIFSLFIYLIDSVQKSVKFDPKAPTILVVQPTVLTFVRF